MNAASVVLVMLGGGDTQTLLDDKKIELYALTGGGDAKNFLNFPSSMLALHTSHLVKLSLPNILYKNALGTH